MFIKIIQNMFNDARASVKSVCEQKIENETGESRYSPFSPVND